LGRLTLLTEICVVVTSPSPTPGDFCTAAITERRPAATACSAARRLSRRTLTENPSLAASFGTLTVASPRTATVRSGAAAAGVASRAAPRTAVIAIDRAIRTVSNGRRLIPWHGQREREAPRGYRGRRSLPVTDSNLARVVQVARLELGDLPNSGFTRWSSTSGAFFSLVFSLWRELWVFWRL
jgi:hypothetical protein